MPGKLDVGRRPFADGTLFDEEEGRTRQSEKDQADINKILARFEMSGILPLVSRPGEYLDLSAVPDYRSALDQVNFANEYFMSLPAEVRVEFGNDPAVFLDAVSNPTPEKLQLLYDSGVLVPPKAEAPADAGGAGAPPGGAAPSVK